MPDEKQQRLRLDKWLWAARFFKTRRLAADAVGEGRVQLNGARTKPSRPVAVGDELVISKGEISWTVAVRGLSGRRRGANEARELYEETEESLARRATEAAARRDKSAAVAPRVGRPTKRERRITDRLRGRS